MTTRTGFVGVLLATAAAACGDDSGGALAPDAGVGGDGAVAAQNAFSSSACKKELAAGSKLAHMRSLKVIDSEAGLDGLRCVAWERVGDAEVKLDLYNFDAACGATWTGDGSLAADGTLALHIDNPSCMIARCGICLYDWSFDLNVSLAANQAVALDVAVDSCQGQQATVHTLATIGPEARGIRCTLAQYGAVNWQASATGTCGQAGMPCEGSLLCGSGSSASTGTCAAGLVCDSSAAANEPVCFVPCTTVADCPRADVFACQAGLCRPAVDAGGPEVAVGAVDAGATEVPAEVSAAVFTFDDNGKTVSVAAGARFNVKLSSIGPYSYGDPVVSTASVQYLGVEVVPPYNPGGPTQQFELVATAKGQAVITIAKVNDAGASLTFTLTVNVE